MSRSITLLLLLLPSLLLAQPHSWLPETQVTRPYPVPGKVYYSRSAAASDGESWLVTWNSRGSNLVTRVLPDGSVDRTLATVVTTGQSNGDPVVVWNGERYLVAWTFRGPAGWAVVGQWVNREGELTGPIEVLVPNAARPLLVSNGSDVLVLVAEGDASVILHRNGSRTVVRHDHFGFNVTAAASDGESFLLVGKLSGTRRTAAARLSSSGRLSPPRTFPELDDLNTRAVTWTGIDYLLVGGRMASVVAMRMNRDGERSSPLLWVSAERPLFTPSVEGLGGGAALVAWQSDDPLPGTSPIVDQDENLIRSAVIDSSNEVSRLEGLGEGNAPVIVASAEAVLFLWNGLDTLRHRILSKSGVAITESLVTFWSAENQRSSAVVAVGRGFFGAWLEGPDTRPRVVVGRVRAGGNARAVPVTASTFSQLEPVVASSGDVVLVAWLEPTGDGTRLMIQRFSSFEMPLEEARSLGRTWSGGYGKVSAAIWDGFQFLVGWTDGDMRYVRISREGVVLDPAPIVIPQSPRAESPYRWTQLSPSFATTGDVTLLVWQNSFRPRGTCIVGPCFPIPPPRIDGIRIDRGGLPIDAIPIPLSRGKELGEEHPRAASVGDSFFVVWDGGLGIGGTEFYRDGTAGPSILYTAGGETVEALTAAADRYFILWRTSDGPGTDELFGSFMLPSQPWQGRVRISSRGVWGDSFPTPLWTFHDGAAAGDENGSVVVLFTRVEPELAAARRVWQRIFGPVHEGRKRAVAR